MDDKRLQEVKQHLQDRDAQNRILKNIERARSGTTVTIGRAAELFRFTENQLRDWEARGLIFPHKSSGGQRLYPLAELDRLAVIRELLDTKKFSPGDIPDNVDVIWNSISPAERGSQAALKDATRKAEEQPIDQRVEQAERDNFWRYFVSQVMRLSLLLISEDLPLPDNIAGLVLPLQPITEMKINDPADLPGAGLSLVGWLSGSRTFYAFLDEYPSFKYPTDFRLERLDKPDWAMPDVFPYQPFIIVQRRARSLVITTEMSETVYRLLQLIYNNVNSWKPCFDVGLRDWVYQVSDLSPEAHVIDNMLNELLNHIIELGGKTPNGKQRWNFAYLLLPRNDSLPLQQRNLDVRVRSSYSPIRSYTFVVSNNNPGLSFRAYQSGHVIYRPYISQHDHLMAYQDAEASTRSAIAIPIPGADGMAVAALYIASDEVEAFSLADRRALRLMTRMIEELLSTYQSRQHVVGTYTGLLNDPDLVDPAFQEFFSEDDFINELEAFLKTIQTRSDIEPQSKPYSEADFDFWLTTKEATSIIAIDIDNQGSLATKYGDRIARNLSREVGMRIRRQLSLLSNTDYRRLYHVNADNYYIKLVGMSLKEARNLAWTLLNSLRGDYLIDARRVVIGRPLKKEDMLELSGVTVRLGVSSYPFAKLKELLIRYAEKGPVETTRSLILENIGLCLKTGQEEGGDVIVSWHHDLWQNKIWVPS